MSLGLKRGLVKLEFHSNIWDESAKDCIKVMSDIFKNDAVDIQHIGSTSIKSIVAKPIIDIVVGVKDFDTILKYNDELKKSGIVYRGQDNDNQLLYVMGDFDKDTRTHHIHVVLWDKKEWNDYINFRDYLNTHTDEAKLYSDLKVELVKDYANNRREYTIRKNKTIESILEKARIWRREEIN